MRGCFSNIFIDFLGSESEGAQTVSREKGDKPFSVPAPRKVSFFLVRSQKLFFQTKELLQPQLRGKGKHPTAMRSPAAAAEKRSGMRRRRRLLGERLGHFPFDAFFGAEEKKG